MRVFYCNTHINFVDENNVYVEYDKIGGWFVSKNITQIANKTKIVKDETFQQNYSFIPKLWGVYQTGYICVVVFKLTRKKALLLHDSIFLNLYNHVGVCQKAKYTMNKPCETITQGEI